MWLHSPDHHTCYLMSGKVGWAWGETFCWLQLDAQFNTPFDAVVWFCAWISQFDIIILVTLCELQCIILDPMCWCVVLDSIIEQKEVHFMCLLLHIVSIPMFSLPQPLVLEEPQYPTSCYFQHCRSFFANLFFFFEQMEPTKTRFLQNVEDNVASSKIEHLSPF